MFPQTEQGNITGNSTDMSPFSSVRRSFSAFHVVSDEKDKENRSQNECSSSGDAAKSKQQLVQKKRPLQPSNIGNITQPITNASHPSKEVAHKVFVRNISVTDALVSVLF